MKFKSIFIVLNLTLLVFLTILILLPLLVMTAPFTGSFWQSTWPFVIFLILILIACNAFYFINRRLFLLLEKEDWPALVRYLEDRVIQKGRYSPRLVRLLANSYLVLSDSQSVMSLENKVALARPALIDANVLLFGTARILGKDLSGAVRFFEVRKGAVKAEGKEWARWYHGFALLLDRRFEKAAVELSVLARLSKDGIVTALSSYFLSGSITGALPERAAELRDSWSEGRERVRKAFPQQADWEKEVARLSTEIHVAVLSRYLNEASRWLYESQERNEL